jgi:hypothetical protein
VPPMSAVHNKVIWTWLPRRLRRGQLHHPV